MARLARVGLSRRVLRHLIFAHNLGVGSSVLDTGCGRGDLVRFFSGLGFRAAGMDESRRNIAVARSSMPQFEFACAAADDAAPWPEHAFDIVLVRRLSVYRGTMKSNSAFRATARLLSFVRPGGFLVYLAYGDQAPSSVASHATCCYVEHLSHFALTPEVADIAEGLFGPKIWKRIVLGHSRWSLKSITVPLPLEPIARGEWMQMADVARFSDAGPCCAWAKSPEVPSSESRSAA